MCGVAAFYAVQSYRESPSKGLEARAQNPVLHTGVRHSVYISKSLVLYCLSSVDRASESKVMLLTKHATNLLPLLCQGDSNVAERQAKDVDEVSDPPEEGKIKADRPVLGLASYAISSIFLASMLTFAKLLGQRQMPVFEILLARSTTILTIALIICAKDRVNPFGNRQATSSPESAFDCNWSLSYPFVTI